MSVRHMWLLLLLPGLAAISSSAAQVESASTAGQSATWTQVSWPFLLDEWGTGRAFRCAGPSCDAEARLFIRVKRGFCNCVARIGDDDEVDRLTDFDFLGGRAQPLGPGQAVFIGDMAGRTRSFAVEATDRGNREATSLVVAKHCEALVALIIFRTATPPEIEKSVIALLRQTAAADLD